MFHHSWVGWLIVSLALGLFLDTYSASHAIELSEVNQINPLPLPAEIFLSGKIINPHASGVALVFDLEKNGKITCYYRHPPQLFFPLNGESYRVHARVEPTPNGKLCIVLEMIPLVLP